MHFFLYLEWEANKSIGGSGNRTKEGNKVVRGLIQGFCYEDIQQILIALSLNSTFRAKHILPRLIGVFSKFLVSFHYNNMLGGLMKHAHYHSALEYGILIGKE